MAPRSSPAKTRSSTAVALGRRRVEAEEVAAVGAHHQVPAARQGGDLGRGRRAASDARRPPRPRRSPAAPKTAPAGPSKRVALTEAEAAELKAFDLTMAFGPMVGLTRLERWERAQEAGLGPPAHLHALLLVLDEQAAARSRSGARARSSRSSAPPTM